MQYYPPPLPPTPVVVNGVVNVQPQIVHAGRPVVTGVPVTSLPIFGAGGATRQDMPLTVGVGALKLPQRWGGHRIPVRLHVFIFVMPVLLALMALVRGGGPAFALVFISFGPLGVLMVLVHELGHIAEAARHGCTPSHILLWPLGGLAVVATCGQSHRQFALIAAAGPATHVPMILGWLLLLASTGQWTTSTGLSTHSLQLDTADGWFAALFLNQVQYNLLTLCFNLLLPCFPLDCSQILVSLLCMRGWPKMEVAKVILVSSAVVLVALCLYAFVGIASGEPTASFGLFGAIWLGLQTHQLYGFYKQGAAALEQYPLFRGGPGGGGGGEGLPPAGRV